MLSALRQRLEKDEEGFTLIELMVVVLIIAILIAIAIPTFLGARQRAQHRSAQSNLRNALTAEKTSYTDASAYTATVATLQGIEPSLNWQATAPTTTGAANQVQVLVSSDGSTVCLSTMAADGKQYDIEDVASGTNPGTFYGNDALPATCPNGTTISGYTNSSSNWA